MKKCQPSFSGKSKKKHRKPPTKPKNLDRRSRQYLTPAEVKKLIEAARNTGRNGSRDALLVLMTYRHALRVSEVIDLQWDQVDLDKAKLHVNRLKNGDASVHHLEGEERQKCLYVKE